MLDQNTFDPRRGWALVKASVEVLRGHKSLLAYPVAGLVGTVTFTVLFLGAGFKAGMGQWWIWISMYLPVMFGFTFTNVALNHELMRAFSGDRVSLLRGFAFALRRIKAILLWSLFAGVVGMLIHKIAEQFGFFGKLIMNMTGTVWSVASVFVIPIMIREESSNPFELLRTSSAIIKRNWKGVLVGFVGLGIEGLLAFAVIPVVLGALGVYIAIVSAVPALDVSDTTACLCLVGALLVASLPVLIFGSIFRCALYIYATEGVVPAPYSPELMDGAWKVE